MADGFFLDLLASALSPYQDQDRRLGHHQVAFALEGYFHRRFPEKQREVSDLSLHRHVPGFGRADLPRLLVQRRGVRDRRAGAGGDDPATLDRLPRDGGGGEIEAAP